MTITKIHILAQHFNPDCKITHSRICWLEIPATSLPRASAFYASVLGWSSDPSQTIPASQIPGTSSLLIFSHPAVNGAFVEVSAPDVSVPKWREESESSEVGGGKVRHRSVMTSFSVESIEEVLDAVVKNGGRVDVPKTKIAAEGMGYFAHFVDTEGNLQGLWSNK
ncbi:hypothetical protein SAPIO_CDS2610 [Scedosporium apiospermum]|uniref:VOC domain-containing protein n=1 Tax=Pseudallescheria apiosperma TaxID=563466 RepID=A0A084GCV0_PSEDA|nr:uncharacterized protein SAPIO_CDS2610 [Scedosporium apiospermum]KEZ45162.1 hypothetical protein SAPIO_CDS2610 [Scedosporium apiospermum]